MFKDYSNVFYEPFNESKVQDTWANYKPTMQSWGQSTVVMTEWGYSNGSGETETDPDLAASYGKPMLQWLEGLGGSWTAWCASNRWLPKMFTDNWTLRVGPREEGGFVKDWPYTNRNVKSPVTF